jgi:hypothetical protein
MVNGFLVAGLTSRGSGGAAVVLSLVGGCDLGAFVDARCLWKVACRTRDFQRSRLDLDVVVVSRVSGLLLSANLGVGFT